MASSCPLRFTTYMSSSVGVIDVDAVLDFVMDGDIVDAPAFVFMSDFSTGAEAEVETEDEEEEEDIITILIIEIIFKLF